jgi:hypothetical protein
MSAATPLIPFEGASAPTASQIANDHSLLKIDQELDFLLERIEDEIEEKGEASREAMDRLQAFAEAMNLKVDRIGRYLSAMQARTAHCKQEAARYAARAKRAESKIERTKEMVLYYLESHNLTQLETDDTTLRRQKNSQDSVIVKNSAAIPPDLKRYELKVDGGVWMKLCLALPDDLAAALQTSVRNTEPLNSAIKQHFAEGGTIEGVEVKRLCHLRAS